MPVPTSVPASQAARADEPAGRSRQLSALPATPATIQVAIRPVNRMIAHDIFRQRSGFMRPSFGRVLA